MSVLVYNGVYLDMVDTQGISRQAIYSDDGTTYHWTLWTFDIIAVINQDATSYSAAGVAAAAQSPVATDTGIRHKLMQPQKQLYYRVGDENLLQCPANGYETDADNGPTPISFDILEIQGISTFLVRYRIECRVNECTGGSRPIILSHRWQTRLEIDQDHFSTRIVQGVAVFRGDEVRSQNVNVDQFRRDLFHPIGQNMQRENVVVDVLSGGNAVQYSFVDREKAFNLGVNSVATRVEMFQSGGVYQPDVAATTTSHIIGELQRGVDRNLQAAAGSTTPQGGAFVAVGLANAVFASAVSLAKSILPRYFAHIVVRAWGNRNSKKSDLRRLAIGTALSKVGGPSLLYATEAVLTEESTGKYVTFEITHRYFSQIQQLALLVSGRNTANVGQFLTSFVAPGLDPVFALFTQSEDLFNSFGGSTATQVDVGNPAFPNSSNSRGTWLGGAVAQALQEPCAVPDAPVGRFRNEDQSFR